MGHLLFIILILSIATISYSAKWKLCTNGNTLIIFGINPGQMENIIRFGNYNATCALYDVGKADGRLMINYSKKYTHTHTNIKIFIY